MSYKKLSLVDHFARLKMTNWNTKENRKTITLSIYATLLNGYVDKNGVLHKLTPGGAAETRFNHLKKRYLNQKRSK